jgi:hypothetical protein
MLPDARLDARLKLWRRRGVCQRLDQFIDPTSRRRRADLQPRQLFPLHREPLPYQIEHTLRLFDHPLVLELLDPRQIGPKQRPLSLGRGAALMLLLG